MTSTPPPTALDKAFQRHSRPQITAFTPSGRDSAQRRSRLLAIQSSPSWTTQTTTKDDIASSELTKRHVRHKQGPLASQWIDFVQLGKLIQGSSELTICLRRRNMSDIVMFSSVGDSPPDNLDAYTALQHENIVAVTDVIHSSSGCHIGSGYTRYTLEELLSTHVPMSGCDGCKGVDHIDAAAADLDDLGLVLLQCMEGAAQQSERTAEVVRANRATNKVFGLADPEKWSGSKQLIDCLDDLFSKQRKVQDKLLKPVNHMLLVR
ncbi:stress-activated protein kinase signaling cascade [Teratosphaeriaceae sp. CCFEE 6253]|nr:stress-activated protein kinase signaling cascade [Teratosphaeriaceae sp. CCFEE 6253]